jgi:hypothetical protein
MDYPLADLVVITGRDHVLTGDDATRADTRPTDAADRLACSTQECS